VYCIQTAEDIVNIFLGPVADSRFFDPERRYQIPRGTPSAGAQNTRENLRFSIEIAVYPETVRERPVVATKRKKEVIGSGSIRVGSDDP